MRERFVEVVDAELDRRPDLALVLADISVGQFEAAGTLARHPGRVVNVGIREQLLVGVAGGMALEGMRPVVHTYAPFLVERAFEQVKLDLEHQDVGAVLVSIGASWDAASEGRTHQAPGDVQLVSTLPGFRIDVPGHRDEAEAVLRQATAGRDRVYVRLSTAANARSHGDGAFVVLRQGPVGAPLVVAVGPVLDAVLAAAADADVSVAYTARLRPFPAAELRRAVTGTDVVLVEPLLAGTSAAPVADALADRPHRLLALGVREVDLRRYGTPAEHARAHGLDTSGIRSALARLASAA